jgi:putative PIG3 family NAD(P)H quinone oxidoreductase
MRAVQLTAHGGPEVLTVTEIADPVPGPDEILVDVVATALNRADLLQRMGFYPGPPEARDIPGLEFAGRVAAVGDRVRTWVPGDKVMGIVGGGACAERLVVHERQAMAIPAAVSLADAAAIPEVFLTAWDALVVQGGLTSGRRALVHAGASGVGTAAIQICGAIGARIAVTASEGKHEALRALGADLVAERSPADWLSVVQAWAPDGVDVVLDVVGELERNLAALRVGGSIVQVGVMGGGTVQFPLGALLPKRAHIIGTVLRPRPLEEKIAISRRVVAEVLPLFNTGALRPVIDSRFALTDLAEAHRRMEANANTGKIIIDVQP